MLGETYLSAMQRLTLMHSMQAAFQGLGQEWRRCLQSISPIICSKVLSAQSLDACLYSATHAVHSLLDQGQVLVSRLSCSVTSAGPLPQEWSRWRGLQVFKAGVNHLTGTYLSLNDHYSRTLQPLVRELLASACICLGRWLTSQIKL